ncbi:MAG: dolichyl-phosphate beta-glucosyltransferase, partial [Actinomycetota bacterium]
MRPETDLSLVLPAYDEGARLPRALEALRTFSVERGLNVEIVVASDGSTDGTVPIAEAWAARRIPGFAVRVVEIPHRGKGAAVRAGMREVTGPVVGYCDVDLSAGPDAIVDLRAAIEAGADVAIASRGLPESVLEVRQPWHRERAGRLFNLALRRLTRITIQDTQCGLKLFRAEVARQLFRHMRIDGFAFDAELMVLAARLGHSVKEVPVRWTHDPGSRLSFRRDSILMARDTIRIVRRLGRAEVHQPGIPALRAIDRMASSEERHWWYVAKRRLVGAMIDRSGNRGRPCLDVGCGAGAMVAEASL